MSELDSRRQFWILFLRTSMVCLPVEGQRNRAFSWTWEVWSGTIQQVLRPPKGSHMNNVLQCEQTCNKQHTFLQKCLSYITAVFISGSWTFMIQRITALIVLIYLFLKVPNVKIFTFTNTSKSDSMWYVIILSELYAHETFQGLVLFGSQPFPSVTKTT